MLLALRRQVTGYREKPGLVCDTLVKMGACLDSANVVIGPTQDRVKSPMTLSCESTIL